MLRPETLIRIPLRTLLMCLYKDVDFHKSVLSCLHNEVFHKTLLMCLYKDVDFHKSLLTWLYICLKVRNLNSYM
jgi:hypothetical protein